MFKHLAIVLFALLLPQTILSNLDSNGPISIEVNGEGTIVGLPDEGTLENDEFYSLEAVPSEDWLFNHWSGVVNSNSESLELSARLIGTAVAHFGRLSQDIGNITTRLIGHLSYWELREADGNKYLIATNSGTSGKLDSGLAWQVEGPGRLSLRFRTTEGISETWIDGVLQKRDYYSGNSSIETQRSLELDLGKGDHDILYIPTHKANSSESRFELLDVQWENGWPLSIEATTGGSIQSTDTESTFAPDGTRISCSAIAEDGFEFAGWEINGISEDTANLEIEIVAPTRIIAIFEKPIADTTDQIFNKQSGHKLWYQSFDYWRSPPNLEYGQFARLTTDAYPGAILHGEARIKDFQEVWWGFDGVLKGRLTTDAPNAGGDPFEIEIPAEANTVFFEVRQKVDGDFWDESSLYNLVYKYPVEIEAIGGQISLDPALLRSVSPEGFKYSGEIERGEELSYRISGSPFKGWEGDIEGESESDTITINSPFHAKATFESGAYKGNGGLWSFTPEDGLFIPVNFSTPPLSISNFDRTHEISTSIEGPAAIEVRFRDIESFVLKNGGIAIEPSFSTNHFGRWYLPDGNNELTLSFKSSETLPNYFSEFDDFVSGIRSIDILPPNRIYYYGSDGGRITVDKTGNQPTGEVVTFTATANENHQFVDWIGEFKGNPNPFTHTIEGDTNVLARFEIETLPGDLTWNLEGLRPVFVGTYLIKYFLEPDEGLSKGSHSTNIEGPGALIFNFENDAKNTETTLTLNGKTSAISIGNNQFQLEEGDNSVTWSTELTDGTQEVSVASFTFPEVKNDFQVFVAYNKDDLSYSTEKQYYQYKEQITITAPETNVDGDVFLRWEIHDPNPPYEPIKVSSETLSLEVDRDYQIQPIFSDDFFNTNLFYLEDNFLTESIEVHTPEGNAAYTLGQSSYIRLFAETDAWISFLHKGPSFTVSGNEVPYNTLIPASREWTRITISVEKDSQLSFRGAQSELVYLGDFQSGPGWRPTLIELNSCGVSYTPNWDEVTEGQTVSISPSVLDHFSGWYDETFTPIDSDSALTIEHGDRKLRYASWAEKIPSDIGTVHLNHAGAWALNPSSSWDNDWKLELISGDNTAQTFGLELEGPTILSIYEQTNGFEIDYLLDGLAITSGYENITKQFEIPTGTHFFSAKPRWENQVNYMSASLSISKAEGSLVTSKSDPFGHVALSPSANNQIYEAGTSITVLAEPDFGYVFTGWDHPFENQEREFTFEVEDSVILSPEFQPLLTDFVANGFRWNGYKVTLSELERFHTGNGETYEGYVNMSDDWNDKGYIETTLTGPVVLESHTNALRLDGLQFGDLPSHLFQYKPEVPLSFKPYQSKQTQFAIPSGSHKLKIVGHSLKVSDAFTAFPGCLLITQGLGCELAVDPLLPYYPVGTKVSVRASNPSSKPIEWFGLPPNAEVTGDTVHFEITDHTRIEAVSWKKENWMIDGLSYGSDLYLSAATDLAKTGTAYANHDDRFLLRYTVDSNGWLNISEIEGDKKVSIYLNGSAPRDSSANSLLSVRSGDKITIAIHSPGLDANEEPWSQGIDTFKLLDSGANPYLDWLNRFPTRDRLHYNFMPEFDADFDGLSNFFEYKSGLNPTLKDTFLSIQIPKKNEMTLTLSLPEAVSIKDVYLETNNTLTEDWRKLENTTDSLQIDDLRHNLRYVIPADQSYPIYFRMKSISDSIEIQQITEELN